MCVLPCPRDIRKSLELDRRASILGARDSWVACVWSSFYLSRACIVLALLLDAPREARSEALARPSCRSVLRAWLPHPQAV